MLFVLFWKRGTWPIRERCIVADDIESGSENKSLHSVQKPLCLKKKSVFKSSVFAPWKLWASAIVGILMRLNTTVYSCGQSQTDYDKDS